MGKHSKPEDNKEKIIREKNKNKKEKEKDNKKEELRFDNDFFSDDIKEEKNGKKNVKKKGKKKKTGRKIFLTILLIIVILAGFFAYKVISNGGGMKGIVRTIVGGNSESIKNLDDLYVLCLGKSQNMTDTIMVAKYSPKEQKVSLLSIPRDSYVGKNTNSTSAFDKINAKYQLDPQKTIDAVNDLTGLNLKYYVTVDTKALRDLVDAIGGVYFDVPIDMNYDDSSQDLAIHLKKGYQLLNGVQAEGVVRFRHNNNYTSYSTEYGDNDLGRMKTQRAFIQAVIKQTLKAENITKVNQLMNIAKEEVKTNLSWDIIKNYIGALMDFDTENLKTDALPGTPKMMGGLSFYVIDKEKARQKVTEMFLTSESTEENNNSNTVNNVSVSTTTTTSKKPSSIKLEVLNGVGDSTKYKEAISQLQNLGYKIVKKGTTNVTNKTLIVDRKNNSKEDENKLKSLLCTGVITSGEDNNDVDFTIIIGTDY